MTRTYQQSDFPLKPFDCRGRLLFAGDFVRVIAIPDVDFHGFGAIARARYAALKGNAFPIDEFDEGGHAVLILWYESATDIAGQISQPAGVDRFETHGFCFDSRDLELEQRPQLAP